MTKIRMKARDVAFPFRMGAGFPGDVNRTHPASIEPCLIDAAAPPAFFGQAVLVDPTTQGVRPFVAGDVAVTKAYGITVRPYPFQQSSGNNYGAAAIGAATAPATGVVDVLRAGYIMGTVVGNTVKNGQVYVWTAASTGSHIQGGFEAAASSGNTATLAGATFNGVQDANGNVEIAFNI
jgi:hypothetical protein